MHPDLILTGCRVETLSPGPAGDGAAGSDAVAIRGGRIVAVGKGTDLREVAGPHTRRVDLAGATLLPGFCDTHMHLEKIVRELAMVQLDQARSLNDVLEAVARAARQQPPGQWIQAFGDDGAWHESQLAEARLPRRAELDRVAPHHPVLLFRGPDTLILNSRGAERLASALDSDTLRSNHPPGEGYDPATGILRSRMAKTLQRSLPGPAPAQYQEMLGSGCRKLLRMGITTVVDPGLPARFDESWRLYRQAREAGHLPQRVFLMNRLDYQQPFATEWARVLASQAKPLDGDEYVRAWAVKLLLDGEFADAWVRDGEPAGGEAARRYSAAELDTVLTACSERGWPLCLHAIGGGAIDFVLGRVNALRARGIRLAPNQLSLAHAFFPSARNLAECRRLDIALAVQPHLPYVFEDEMQSAWGNYAQQAMPLAAMLEAGITVAGGSDVLPCEPLLGARMAVQRICRQGYRLDPDQAITPRQALLLYTRSGGEYISCPAISGPDLGRIRPGCAADLVAWPRNPLHTPPEEWLTLAPHLVTINGRIVYEG